VDLSKTIITSERLFLRVIEREDAGVIFSCFSDRVTKYMYPKAPEALSETKDFIEKALARVAAGANLQLVVLAREDRRFLGCVGLHDVDTRHPELGVWIREDEHRHGYGLEAVSLVIEWAKKHIEFDHLVYPVDKRNLASRRIPEAHGGIVKKEFKSVNLSGFELDEVEYWIFP